MAPARAGAHGDGRPKRLDDLARAAPDKGLDRRGVHRRRRPLPERASSDSVFLANPRLPVRRRLFVRADQLRRTPAARHHSRTLNLHRMRVLTEQLGNPGHERFRVVHMAGTKGKGSTAAMVSSASRRPAFAAGLLSPHLDRLEERFRLFGRPGDATALELIEGLTDAVRDAVAALDAEGVPRQAESTQGRTFFEITTAMGLLHFPDRRRADAVVLEVGMGGRLDLTNDGPPAPSPWDHVHLVRSREAARATTLAAIAGEKAGIIDEGGWADRQRRDPARAVPRD